MDYILNNKGEKQGYRHGDLGFVKIKAISDGLKPSKTNILLQTGSSGHPHSFKGGKFYPKKEGDYVIGYFKAVKTKLYHPEHGDKKVNGLKEARIDNGFYEVSRANEVTPNGLRLVID